MRMGEGRSCPTSTKQKGRYCIRYGLRDDIIIPCDRSRTCRTHWGQCDDIIIPTHWGQCDDIIIPCGLSRTCKTHWGLRDDIIIPTHWGQCDDIIIPCGFSRSCRTHWGRRKHDPQLGSWSTPIAAVMGRSGSVTAMDDVGQLTLFSITLSFRLVAFLGCYLTQNPEASPVIARSPRPVDFPGGSRGIRPARPSGVRVDPLILNTGQTTRDWRSRCHDMGSFTKGRSSRVLNLSAVFLKELQHSQGSLITKSFFFCPQPTRSSSESISSRPGSSIPGSPGHTIYVSLCVCSCPSNCPSDCLSSSFPCPNRNRTFLFPQTYSLQFLPFTSGPTQTAPSPPVSPLDISIPLPHQYNPAPVAHSPRQWLLLLGSNPSKKSAKVDNEILDYRDLAAIPRVKAIYDIERPDLITYEPFYSTSLEEKQERQSVGEDVVVTYTLCQQPLTSRRERSPLLDQCVSGPRPWTPEKGPPRSFRLPLTADPQSALPVLMTSQTSAHPVLMISQTFLHSCERTA
ncbi:hypothetical protein JZ751_025890 [Albula glossodonta]|uniref:Putative adherens-junction anchoring domain-containing protein n=1 Tax=Albula glossodonta TaxID=121402 RepID=A0A8T2NCZ8_9TELE|nr:hypothetical protein JZ751_025890 [Albula glossodonta]